MREKPRNFAKMRQPPEQRKEKPPRAIQKRLRFFSKYGILSIMRVGGEAAAPCTGNPL